LFPLLVANLARLSNSNFLQLPTYFLHDQEKKGAIKTSLNNKEQGREIKQATERQLQRRRRALLIGREKGWERGGKKWRGRV